MGPRRDGRRGAAAGRGAPDAGAPPVVGVPPVAVRGARSREGTGLGVRRGPARAPGPGTRIPECGSGTPSVHGAVHKSAVILELLKKENVIRKNVIRKSLTQKCKSVALTINRPHGKPVVDDPAVPELVSDVLPAQSIVKCQIQSQHVAGM